MELFFLVYAPALGDFVQSSSLDCCHLLTSRSFSSPDLYPKCQAYIFNYLCGISPQGHLKFNSPDLIPLKSFLQACSRKDNSSLCCQTETLKSFLSLPSLTPTSVSKFILLYLQTIVEFIPSTVWSKPLPSLLDFYNSLQKLVSLPFHLLPSDRPQHSIQNDLRSSHST